jgi:putative RNA 2'-phosphotransferase
MDSKAHVRTSKFLSLVLRHKPEEAGLTLGEDGFCRISDLIKGCCASGHHIDRETLDLIVENNDKKRFQYSEDGQSIRAVQGHSIEVDLGYEPSLPPAILYHGTATRFLDPIRQQGLVKGSRQHVHLSATLNTARTVGARHGNPVVIPIDAETMHRDGNPFFLTPNGVWLVEAVPPKYLQFHNIAW